MDILMVAHIGETLGHLVRGLAVADELIAAGRDVEFAASTDAEWLLKNWKYPYKHHRLAWKFSHNSCDPYKPPQKFLNHICEANLNLIDLLRRDRPRLIVGLPGIFTTQIARHLKIPHVSILHGPYLSPIISLDKMTPVESVIMDFTKEIFLGGCIDAIYSQLSRKLGFPRLSYKDYLVSETIFVPQPDLPLPSRENIHQFRFIRASFGPLLDDHEIQNREACYITFGSGNPCNISRIVKLARIVFPYVIVSVGRTQLHNVPQDVKSMPFIASSSLVNHISALISHGGIGTVGTFAEYGTPQLIIPTELDQATMAVHAARQGIAKHCGLENWAKNPRLGRRLPAFDEDHFLTLLHGLLSESKYSKQIVSSGAHDIASALIHTLDTVLQEASSKDTTIRTVSANFCMQRRSSATRDENNCITMESI